MNVALFEAILDHANIAMADQFPGQKGLLKEQAIALLDLVLDDMKARPQTEDDRLFHSRREMPAYQSNDLDQELADAQRRWSGEADRCGDPADWGGEG
jgi:hypothetical protein